MIRHWGAEIHMHHPPQTRGVVHMVFDGEPRWCIRFLHRLDLRNVEPASSMRHQTVYSSHITNLSSAISRFGQSLQIVMGKHAWVQAQTTLEQIRTNSHTHTHTYKLPRTGTSWSHFLIKSRKRAYLLCKTNARCRSKTMKTSVC